MFVLVKVRLTENKNTFEFFFASKHDRLRKCFCSSPPSQNTSTYEDPTGVRQINRMLQSSLILANARVVLVSPKVPENIGAVLRVAANFEAQGVVIVDPRCDAFGPQVLRVACDSPLVSTMQVVPTLGNALASTSSSIAFTRRAGRGRITHPSIGALLAAFPLVWAPLSTLCDDSAQLGSTVLDDAPTSVQSQLALVFGREESGLLDEEVGVCAHACAIPSGSLFPSLNLSHAVAVVLSQLFDVTLAMRTNANGGEHNKETNLEMDEEAARMAFLRERWSVPAVYEDVEALLARAAALLESAGINTEVSSGGGDKGNHGRRRKSFGHLRALMNRAMATKAEVRALHAILRELERRRPD